MAKTLWLPRDSTKDISICDAQGEQAEQRHQNESKRPGAGVDETAVVKRFRVGGTPPPAPNPSPCCEPERDQYDDQKYCHQTPKKGLGR